MPATPHLGLPLIAAAQAQKHVTHNEALHGLDALVHLAVIRRDLTLPPASPAEGDRYIVGPDPSGAWAGRAGEIAHWLDGLWRFHPPRPGWLAYLLNERAIVAWTGSAWVPALQAVGEVEFARLGIGTAPSAAAPLSAKLNAALLTARARGEGGSGDLRSTLNKEGGANVASLLFQSGYSGRAEIGLIGDDDLGLKVSADGQAWTEALRVDRATGQVSFPAGAALPVGGRNRIINGAFTVNQRGHVSGAALAAGAYAHDRWKAGADGCAYTFAPGKAATLITLTAGSLVQVIEDVNVEGGTLVLSWAGTAQARIGVNGAAPSGAYASMPAGGLVVGGVEAGQAATVEFRAGTLGLVQAEFARLASPFEGRHRSVELLLCQRYYEVMEVGMRVIYAQANGYYGGIERFAVEKAAIPTIAHLGSLVAVGFPTTAPGIVEVTARNLTAYKNAAITGNAGWSDRIATSAEL